MSGRKDTFPRPVEFGVVALILGVLSCCLWPVVRDARGPYGEPIPKQPPDEANRVHHPFGYSIVAPPNWYSLSRETLMMVPMTRGRHGTRSKALIFVSYCGRKGPPDLQGLQKTRFLGQEAYEGMKVIRKWTFDDGAWSEYRLVCRHGDAWYEIKYGIAEERTSLPARVREYLNTLRWDEVRPDLPF